tara:strand:- start:452 stop:889 length:438 start_codon:yes stop_codon:yes gene_type:complete
MTKLIKELKKLKEEILSEKESLLLFAMFSRNGSDDEYDLVISADWITAGETRTAVKYLIEKLKEKKIDLNDYVRNIVAFSPEEHFIHHIALAYKEGRVVESSGEEVRIKLFDDYIIRAVVLREDFESFDIKALNKKTKTEYTAAF